VLDAQNGLSSSDGRYVAWTDFWLRQVAVVDLEAGRIKTGRLPGWTAGLFPLAVSGGRLALGVEDGIETGWLARLMVLDLLSGVWGTIARKERALESHEPGSFDGLSFVGPRVSWHEWNGPTGADTRIQWRDLTSGAGGEYGRTFGTAVEYPVIDGDWLVFFEYSGPWATNDVVAVNLVTQERRRITENSHAKFDLALRGSLVVWTEDTSGPDGDGLSLDGDIWQHDLATGETLPLIVAPELQAGAWLSGDHLLWVDLRDGAWAGRGPPVRASAWYLNLARSDPPIKIGSVPHAVTFPRLVGDYLVWRDTAEEPYTIWAMPWSPPP